jgi:hypothetical protein
MLFGNWIQGSNTANSTTREDHELYLYRRKCMWLSWGDSHRNQGQSGFAISTVCLLLRVHWISDTHCSGRGTGLTIQKRVFGEGKCNRLHDVLSITVLDMCEWISQHRSSIACLPWSENRLLRFYSSFSSIRLPSSQHTSLKLILILSFVLVIVLARENGRCQVCFVW